MLARLRTEHVLLFGLVATFTCSPFAFFALIAFELPRSTTAAIAGPPARLRSKPRTPSARIGTPEYLCEYGLIRWEEGRTEEAVAYFTRAINKNPGDKGADYQITAPRARAQLDLEHGKQQVRRMLKDRPEMGEHTQEGDFLWDWAARKYAGEDLRARIVWERSPPIGASAQHIPPGRGSPGRIFVAPSGHNRGFEELWSDAIFELHNINGALDFYLAHLQGIGGTISKEQYVFAILRAEHDALQRTRAFYVHEFLPWAVKRRVPSKPKKWYLNSVWWGDAEKCLAQYISVGGPNLTHYAGQFDRLRWNREAYASAIGWMR